ncbi:MAG: RpiB/LacA/LacB family sugar-phosphate isomerase [Limnochordia bacterium]
MKIAIGSDHLGLSLKRFVMDVLREHGVEYEDFGSYSDEAVDYPDIGAKVAEALAGGAFDRGILICGTGIGMAIVANKVPGVRAAVAHDSIHHDRSGHGFPARFHLLPHGQLDLPELL